MRRYVERSLWCYRLEVCTEVGCLHRRLLVGIQWRIVEQLFRERQRRYYGGIALQDLKSRGRHDLSPLSSPRKRGPITPASGILVSFLLAMFGHAGPVGVDLLVAPEVLRITRRPNAALVQGLRPLRADSDAAAFLRVARRCQRGHGERQRKRSQTFLKVNHDESLCYCRLVTDTSRRRGRTRLLRLAAKRLPFRQLICPTRASLVRVWPGSVASQRQQRKAKPKY